MVRLYQRARTASTEDNTALVIGARFFPKAPRRTAEVLDDLTGQRLGHEVAEWKRFLQTISR